MAERSKGHWVEIETTRREDESGTLGGQTGVTFEVLDNLTQEMWYIGETTESVGGILGRQVAVREKVKDFKRGGYLTRNKKQRI